MLNLCANNYLGLADHPEIVAAARDALDGGATAWRRCGSSAAPRSCTASSRQQIATFLGKEDAILYGSCFDANGGLFETLLGARRRRHLRRAQPRQHHRRLRLCKAAAAALQHGDMADLEARLGEAKPSPATTDRHRRRLLDGRLPGEAAEICDLADRYDAMVMVDDSHAVGFMGASGRGTHEQHDVIGRVDILTGTLGKALGGASGGYVAARAEIVDLLRQRSRPYLFSNSLAPPIVAASLHALDLIERSSDLRERLAANTAHFRAGMTELRFDILPG